MTERDPPPSAPAAGTDGTRAQAHTLEAVAASIVLLSAIVFALQVTAVTPLSGSTSNQHIETQQAEMAEGLLSGEAENGSLRRAVLYYNASGNRFHDAAGARGEYEGRVPTGPDPPRFVLGTALSETFLERGIAVNVNLYHLDGGDRRRQPLIELGTPSDHAATATRQVTLFDDDELRDDHGDPTGETLGSVATDSDREYFAGNEFDSPVYNVVEVEVVVWRT
ncbi:hypothetical protein [Halopenitus sp. POP-27]|uniref:DUF7288 family protein n=1 Tax=Halopenitus sp. POP-27 TaxID=2994425 RepID=UPI0024698748|nr:hypothetical protein [Halopenitus sp. POP-27]